MRFIVHIFWLYARIATGKPAYKEMKDSFTTLMLFTAISMIAMACLWVPALRFFDGTLPTAHLLNIGLAGLMPAMLCLIWMQFHKGSNALFSAILGGFAVVDLAAGMLWLAGVIQGPMMISYFVAKAMYCGLAYREFERQEQDVKEMGYGLKDGEY